MSDGRAGRPTSADRDLDQRRAVALERTMNRSADRVTIAGFALANFAPSGQIAVRIWLFIGLAVRGVPEVVRAFPGPRSKGRRGEANTLKLFVKMRRRSRSAANLLA
jgi:hypothetical protein